MICDLPEFDTLYAALCDRDARFEGRAWVCVTSTGIFCRLTCPARKPKPENCRFEANIETCLRNGYRACKRCTPLTPEGDSLITPLIEAIEADPTRRWREADIAAFGIDPTTARRGFRRAFGVSFLEFARLRRLGAGFTILADGGSVLAAQLEAGFESPSAFRDAFARIIGCAPGKLASDSPLKADWITTELGPMVAICDTSHLQVLDFIDRKTLPQRIKDLQAHMQHPVSIGKTDISQQIAKELQRYFAGKNMNFTTPIKMHGTDFTQQVWRGLQAIPAGKTRSYRELAESIGKPKAQRAVARANGANPLSIIVPCHRVIGADGTMNGYGGGMWRKQRLIEIEAEYHLNN